ncbi:hypothetical protein [Muriicola sp. Z0-33]|uniref:hypothetical protein n=1 Tax=Muriicola sp. Z0-33 TaxID=2816957 RepID=UPI002237A1D8|nr:hypothetical protein [Muriicola sp. Z0-33]MCW5518138.1 hypothetical protein [Muriicola sp. Z0-33]
MMKTIKNKVLISISRLSKLLMISMIISPTLVACQSDDSIETLIQPEPFILTTNSGNLITMNGLWSTGCVEANNDTILSETLSFNNENLQINITGFDDLPCNGNANFYETVAITFSNAGTISVTFNGAQVLVNQIYGTATYNDGRVEDFKQIFFIDDSSNETYMHHAVTQSDGGQVNDEGYPIDIIPISIIKTN